MQKTQIITSKNITCKLRNIIQQGNIITTYASPLEIIKIEYNIYKLTLTLTFAP